MSIGLPTSWRVCANCVKANKVGVEQRRVQRVDLDEDVSVEREETGEEGTDDDVGDDFLAEVVLVISRGRSCVNLDAVADELSGDVELGPILLN